MIPNTQAVTAVAPIVVLGAVLVALLFFPVPTPNRELVMTIVAGLLGYLSRGERRASDRSGDDR